MFLAVSIEQAPTDDIVFTLDIGYYHVPDFDWHNKYLQCRDRGMADVIWVKVEIPWLSKRMRFGIKLIRVNVITEEVQKCVYAKVYSSVGLVSS